MMRGGSVLAKVSRSSGSRQYSSSANERRGGRIKTLDDAYKILPRVLKNLFLYGLETLAFKGVIFYVGYKAALRNSPFQPEKYAPELVSLYEKKLLLDVEFKQLEKNERLLAQLEAQIRKTSN